MTDEQYMRLAISEAEKSKEPLKCGVVIVKDGEIIAQAYNSQRADHNATAHAEIKAIGEAGQKMQDKNLIGCTVYGTCEPCSMCLSAMIFAKVDRLVFSVDLASVSYIRPAITSTQLINGSDHKLVIVGGILEQECRKRIYKNL